MSRLGAVGGAFVVTAGLVLAACGGGSSSSAAKAGAAATTENTVVGQQGSGDASTNGNGSTAGGNPAGATATSGTHPPQGTPVTHPAGTTTTSPAATTTTRLNTITPIPGKPAPPAFNTHETGAYPEYGFDIQRPNGDTVGVCGGDPPRTEMDLHWQTYGADFVEINRGSTNYAASWTESNVPADCYLFFSQPIASVVLTAFGPGGETSLSVNIDVDKQARP